MVAVHRLREVFCLYGFTRFEAAPTSADGELEDIQLAVRGALLVQDADWLPAIDFYPPAIHSRSRAQTSKMAESDEAGLGKSSVSC